MTARITAPVRGLNGTGVGGLKFVDSVAETDNEAIIAYCESAGYTVDRDGAAPSSDDAPKAKALKDLTGPELDKLAAAEEIDLTGHKSSKATKAAAIEAARKAKAEAEQYALDHTFVVTVKNAAGEEHTLDVVDEDEDAIRATFDDSDEAKDKGLEIVSIDKKLTGEPTEQV